MQRPSLYRFTSGMAAILVLGSAAMAQSAEGLNLTFSQRGGEGAIEIRNENGRPGDIYLTAMSLIQTNEFLPGVVKRLVVGEQHRFRLAHQRPIRQPGLEIVSRPLIGLGRPLVARRNMR